MTARADAEKGHMTINTHVAACRFQFVIKLLKQRMLHLQLITADSTDDMVMIVPGNFILEVTIPSLGWAHQAVLCEELEGAVNGRFRKAG